MTRSIYCDSYRGLFACGLPSDPPSAGPGKSCEDSAMANLSKSNRFNDFFELVYKEVIAVVNFSEQSPGGDPGQVAEANDATRDEVFYSQLEECSQSKEQFIRESLGEPYGRNSEPLMQGGMKELNDLLCYSETILKNFEINSSRQALAVAQHSPEYNGNGFAQPEPGAEDPRLSGSAMSREPKPNEPGEEPS